MAEIIVRGVDDDLVKALKVRADQESSSVEAVVVRLLEEGLGGAVPATGEHHDLDALAGTWSPADAAEFEQATEPTRQVDRNLWQAAE